MAHYYKDMSKDELFSYLESVEAGIAKVRAYIEENQAVADEFNAQERPIAAYPYTLRANEAKLALAMANLWAFEQEA